MLHPCPQAPTARSSCRLRCACVCVCVRERERERVCVCVCVCVRSHHSAARSMAPCLSSPGLLSQFLLAICLSLRLSLANKDALCRARACTNTHSHSSHARSLHLLDPHCLSLSLLALLSSLCQHFSHMIFAHTYKHTCTHT